MGMKLNKRKKSEKKRRERERRKGRRKKEKKLIFQLKLWKVEKKTYRSKDTEKTGRRVDFLFLN